MVEKKNYKIIHIADTHIKLIKQQREYRTIFAKMYEILKTEKPDLILHCGDLFHSKTNLSPEAVYMAMDFLKSLADIAPVYIIPGNHDCLLKNSQRMDAITPVVNALQHPNLHYLKNSQEIHIDDKLCLNALSIVDEDNWKKISDPNKINIALYHGSLSGVVTDQGYVLEYGDHPIEIFEGFDYALLGDIHKTFQKLDPEGRVAYPGSTIQQNHGETNDKGFLIWDIESKDKFNCRHIAIPNPAPFITIELEADGQLPERLTVPDNSKLRLVSNTHLSVQTLKKAADIAKTRFSPESLTIHNRPGKRISVSEMSNTYEEDNLRDITVQESLIREYLKEFKLSDDIQQKVFELNKKYNVLAEQTEEVARNINWKLKSLEWNNLFNYGEGNKINFEKINGILGIFGKNYTGKSSVIDSFLWIIFNSISKNVRKNVDIINQNRDKCSGKVELEIDNKIYTIERESEKYIKKLYGEETVEAKTILNFSVFDKVTDTMTNLNGLSRTETDENIRKIFGTIEDFLLTSMTSQMGALNFINEGSTKRKEIFGKFLDLEMFDKKHELSKDDSSLLKGAIKRLEGKKFDEEIEETIQGIKENENKIDENKKLYEEEKAKLQELYNERSKINGKIASGPKQKLINIDSLEKNISHTSDSIASATNKNNEFAKQIETKQNEYRIICKSLSDFDYDELRNNKQKAEKRGKELIQATNDIKLLNQAINTKKSSIEILNSVPCGDKFPSCRFLVDANANKVSIENDINNFKIKETEANGIKEEYIQFNSTLTDLQKYEALVEKKNILEKEIAEISLRQEKNLSILTSFKNSSVTLNDEKKFYFENENWMKQLQDLNSKKQELERKIVLTQVVSETTEHDAKKLYNTHGSLVQKKLTLEQEKQELSRLRDEFFAYDLFSKCTHSNGIVYDIIKKKLPIINQEISKVLSNIVNFDIFFEDDGKKLDIYIKHPKYDPRPLELCSGAEKSIAAIAIRLSLIKVSSLPISDIFILDEPATSLDEESMEGFTRILEMIKSQFKIVIMISHLDVLKDVVDDQINIEKVDGFAKINM